MNQPHMYESAPKQMYEPSQLCMHYFGASMKEIDWQTGWTYFPVDKNEPLVGMPG